MPKPGRGKALQDMAAMPSARQVSAGEGRGRNRRERPRGWAGRPAAQPLRLGPGDGLGVFLSTQILSLNNPNRKVSCNLKIKPQLALMLNQNCDD